jgi:hemoglobin
MAACGKGDKGKTDKAAAVVPTPPSAMADAQEAAPPPAKPLFERLGGLPAISMVVSDFIDALVVDDVLNANPKIKAARDKVPAPYLKYHVTALVCQTTGGPCVYDGRSMKDSHAHLGITEAEWNQLAKVFKTILDKYKVPEPEQQELFKIVGTTHDDIVTVK